MRAFAPLSKGLMSRILTSVALGISLALPAAAEPAPTRVVSINLCTDQLAMLLAAPGQLISVSYLSSDPNWSPLRSQAAELISNRGLAEEIYLMQPDLVIAGTYSSRATLSMLRRLDVPVAVLDPANSLEDTRARIEQMGDILHRQEAAAALIEQYDRDLAAISAKIPQERPLAALYYANGYTSGERSLAGEILTAAGFRNASVELGMSMGGILPLELLAMSDPDALVTGWRHPAASRSEEILDHPVVSHLASNRVRGSVTDRDWVCGTPFVLRAIEGLAALRDTPKELN